ncbi:MAG: hypothetical protein ACK4OL_14640, partial [Hyphomonas sp.]
GNRPERSPERGQDRRPGGGPKPPERRSKPIDPDSPFAALAALLPPPKPPKPHKPARPKQTQKPAAAPGAFRYRPFR